MKKLLSTLLLVILLVACTPQSAPATLVPAPTATIPLAAATPAAPGTPISQIKMFDASRGWGWSQDVGGNSRLMSTEDGGKTWVDRSPTDYAFGQQGAAFLDAHHAWVPTFDTGGDRAGLIRTADGGKTWTAVAGAAGPYTAYDFASASDGLANTADVGAGNAYVRFYQTHDGGLTWSPLPIAGSTPESLPEGTLHICNICGDTASVFLPERVIITHGDLAGDPQGAVRLSLSTDLGKHWSELKLPLPSASMNGAAVAPLAPTFFDEQHGVMPVHIFKTKDFTNYDYRDLALYTTSDGGQTWVASASMAEQVQVFESALDVISMTQAVVRCGNNLCQTADAGQTWAVVKPDLDFGEFGGEHQLTQIDFIDLKTGWAVIDDDDVYRLYGSTDGGATWNALAR